MSCNFERNRSRRNARVQVPTPWLDDKHTVFGKVSVGMEVCQAIENVSCNRFDKPYEDVKIINIEIS